MYKMANVDKNRSLGMGKYTPCQEQVGKYSTKRLKIPIDLHLDYFYSRNASEYREKQRTPETLRKNMYFSTCLRISVVLATHAYSVQPHSQGFFLWNWDARLNFKGKCPGNEVVFQDFPFLVLNTSFTFLSLCRDLTSCVSSKYFSFLNIISSIL